MHLTICASKKINVKESLCRSSFDTHLYPLASLIIDSLLIMRGMPNSVTIVASSAQTAADVEFANFLTRNYFENTSATIRKSILFQ